MMVMYSFFFFFPHHSFIFYFFLLVNASAFYSFKKTRPLSPMSFHPDVRFCDTLIDVCSCALELILSITEENMNAGRKTVFALSGGETPKTLYEMMAKHLDLFKEKKAITFIMGDDRLYPLDHKESNSFWATEKLLKHLPEDVYIRMDPTPAVKTSESEKEGEPGARAVASQYETQLLELLPTVEVLNAAQKMVQIPQLDIVLLGFGADGHCASIFPDSIAFRETEKSVTVSWPSPTMVPKVWRATLSPHVIQHAKHVIILVCRDEKSWVVRGVLEDEPKGDVPVSRFLRNCKGKVHFVLDNGAATGTPKA